MKIALVHDYLNEFGGAERVLRVLADIYPEAPIYTAFKVDGSTAAKAFSDRKIVESFFAPLLKIGKLYSPLRFLAPLVWRNFDLSKFDLVITSSSWFITRGFKVGAKTKVICYCHTPPRWLYGYETSVGFQKYWPVKIYAAIVGHFMRMYDFSSAQEIKHWVANSKNVQDRIKKFYRKESSVIYPPVDVENIIRKTKALKKEDYFLIVSRLVGAKGLDVAVKAFKKSKYKLKIVGEAFGFSDIGSQVTNSNSENIEFLGRINDDKLYELYGKAKGFIALAKDEDFGMTLVEAQAAGTPVIAFSGGGFKETVAHGKTGILLNEVSNDAILAAVEKLKKIKWDREVLMANTKRFSKEKFEKDFQSFVSRVS